MAEDTKPKSLLEQHFNTLIGVVIVGVMSWVGITTANTATQIEVLSTQVEFLQGQFTDLREGTKDRYTKDDAARDFNFRDNILEDLLRRMDRVEELVLFNSDS